MIGSLDSDELAMLYMFVEKMSVVSPMDVVVTINMIKMKFDDEKSRR